MNPKPIVILGYGNPSRGDDALAPRLLDQLQQLQDEAQLDDRFDAITDFQLQIEHTLDLQGRQVALFIDASMDAAAPFEFSRLQAVQDDSYTSHALSPAALLNVFDQVNEGPAPAAFLLAIPGYRFELGEELTAEAESNLALAVAFTRKLLSDQPIEAWDALCPTA